MTIACRTPSLGYLGLYGTFRNKWVSGNYVGRKVSSQPALANLSIVGASSWHFVNARWNPFAERRRREPSSTRPRPDLPQGVRARSERDEAGMVFLAPGGGRRGCPGESGGCPKESPGCAARAASNNKCEGHPQVFRRHPRHQVGIRRMLIRTRGLVPGNSFLSDLIGNRLSGRA